MKIMLLRHYAYVMAKFALSQKIHKPSVSMAEKKFPVILKYSVLEQNTPCRQRIIRNTVAYNAYNYDCPILPA